jgi:hypothetical protein
LSTSSFRKQDDIIEEFYDGYMVKFKEGQWEECWQHDCNNNNCPYPHKMWWNKFIKNPNTGKLQPLMEPYYVTDNNVNKSETEGEPKIHRCMEEHPPSKWTNKDDNRRYKYIGKLYDDSIIFETDSPEVKAEKMKMQDRLVGRDESGLTSLQRYFRDLDPKLKKKYEEEDKKWRDFTIEF